MEQTLTKLRQNSRVSVIGGGISGLSFAYFLGKLRPDIKITIYEKDNRVGGYINTCQANEKTENDTGLHDKLSLKMEKGPRTLRGISSGTLMIIDLLNKFNKLDQLRGVHSGSTGNKKYLLRDIKSSYTQFGQMTGELIEVPGPNCGLSTTLNFLFNNYGKIILLSIIKDFFFKETELDKDKLNEKLDNMSVEEFFNRHFDNKLINEIGSALMYGIYAADSADLNVNCVMKRMVDLEKYKGSLIKSLISKNKNKNKNSNDKEKDKLTLDKDIQLYINKFGTEFNLLNLSKLLKKFPMLSLTDGLSVLCDGIKDNLPPNVYLKLDEEVKSINKKGDKMIIKVKGDQNGVEFDHVRSTINSCILGNMIGDPKISEKLKDFKYTSVTVCNVLIPKNHIKKYQGFGFLVPKIKFNKQARVMGVIFDSDVEENSSLIFPKGNKSIPRILKCESEFNQNNIVEFEKNIINENNKQQSGCTKVTLMLNIDNKDRIEVTNSRLRKIVEETFINILGFDLTQLKVINGNNWSLEKDTLWDSIPLYDIQGEGFIVRKRELLKMIKDEPLSLGGMTFASGVGVPDNVVSSMKAAVDLSGM